MDRVDIRAVVSGRSLHPALLVLAAVAAVGALANPTGGDVSAGSANISQSGSAVTIDQTSARVAINWQSFNIGAGESVTFNQPSAQAVALNRILGQDPSLIQGALKANGQIFLLNPNGVIFGAGAQVDVGGIVASTLGLSNDDFLAGRYTFTTSGNAGSVLNEGTIRAADGGYVAFAGSNVTNAGVIRAHLGTVALGAGDQVTLNIDGERLVGFNVDKAAVAALADNRQLIEADGGTVILSARAKDALLATVVNNDGVIEARSVNARNGVIELDGGTDGVVAVGGTLDASGIGSGERGGRVDVTGDNVALMEGAVVDASGSTGGGTVRIGGDFHGANPDVDNASRTFVASSATIKADALDTGDGGKVAVWADGDTRFNGSISARGGENGGDGGFVEVSGKQQLGFDGGVDTSAVRGAIGTLLLDPDDLIIAAANPGGGALPDTTNPFLATNGVNNFYVLGSTLTGLLPSTAILLQANHNIIFQTNLTMPTNGAGSMTMTASNAIQMAGFDLSTAGANVSMTAGGGGITNLGTINLGGGTLTLSSPGAITQNAGDVIAGTTSLVKQGTGTLTFSNANTYTGTTTVGDGTLRLSAANRIADTSALTVASVATFDLNSFAETVGSLAGAGNVTLGTQTLTAGGNGTSTTFSGVVSGTGGLTKTGGGILTLSGSNTYTGATTINAGTLRASGGFAIADGSQVTLANVATAFLDLANSEAIGNLSGGGTTGGNVTLNGNTLTVNEAGTTTYSGVASGAGGITKQGVGTLTLSGNNAYTGATTVNVGTLRLGAANRIADTSALTVAGGATFDLNNQAETVGSLAGAGNVTLGTQTLTAGGNGTSTSFSGVASGTGGLTKSGGGIMTLSGINTYTGATTINAGTLRASGGFAIADASQVTLANVATAFFDLTNNEAIGNLSGGGTTGGTVTLNGNTLTVNEAAATTFGGVVSGSGGLTKQGAAVLTLSGANTYTGATTVNVGTLRLGAANRIADTSALTIAGGATFDLNNQAEAVGSIAGAGNITLGSAILTAGGDGTTTAFSGLASGTGGLTKTGAGMLTLSGANAYTGATTINGGTLRATGAAIADTSQVTLGNVAGATFDITGNERIGNLSGGGPLGGAVTLNGNTLTVNQGGNTAFAGVASGSGGLIKQGAGVLTLSGANTYTGDTTITAGTVALGASNALSDNTHVIVNNGTFAVGANSDTVAGVQLLVGSITGSSGVLTSTSDYDLQAGTAGAILGGTAGLNKSTGGTVVLSGVNTYTGATAVNGGILRLSAANRIADTSALTVASGATFDLNSFAETVGSLAGAGNVTLGTQTLTTGADGTSTTFSGVVSGTGGLAKTGGGILTLSGINTYTGATTISAGTVRASGGFAIADGSQVTLANVAGATLDLTASERIGNLSGGGPLGGAVTLNGNTLTVNQGGNTTFAGVASGAGAVIKQGAGILTLSGANTYTGDTSVTAGTLTLGASNVLADATHVVVNGGTLAQTTNSDTVAGVQLVAGSITGSTGTLTSTSAYDLQSGTVSSILGGTVGVNKSTGGTVIVSGANTYTGATSVSAGTLAVTVNNALGTTAGATTVGPGATLDLRNVTYGTAEAVTLNGGTLATSTGTSSFTGAVTLGANSAVNVAGTQLTLSGAIGGATFGIDKQGVGRLVLSGLETYTGATVVSGGMLRLGAANRIADASAVTVAAGATFDLNNFAETVGSLDGAGNVTLGSATLTAGGDGTSTTFSGVVSGAGGLTKAGVGALTLSGANSYGGATAINAGTLVAANSSALGATTGATTVANAATLRIANFAIGAEAVTLNGAGLGGNGALVGTGAASLGGAVAIASNSTIAATGVGDTLALAGTVNGPGALTQTGAGTVAFGGAVGGTTALASFTSNAGSTTQINGSSLRTTGTQLYNGALGIGGATTLRTTNAAITANGAVNATAGALTIVAGTGSATFTNAANNFGTVGVTNAGAVNLVDANGLNLAASSVSTLRAQTLAGDITVSGIISATGAGDSIVLASGGNFVNTVGSAALNPGAGRWLAWSTNPSLDTQGGLANVFKQYNATYGVTTVAAGGNGFLYTLAPIVSIGLTGVVSQVYDGSTNALLAPSNYNVSGAVDGDTIALNNPAGTYDTRNVGTNKNVAVSGLAITSATNSGKTVYGYQLGNTSANANIGTITPAALTVTATTNSKTYDGTTSAAATPIATGLVGGDTATGLAEVYADKNAGTGKTLLVSSYTVNDGNGGNNYTVSLVNDTTGVIDQAALTGNITAANKTYDGTNAATIDSRTLSGVIAGDAVSYVGGTATFSDKNAALGKLVTATGLGLTGADAGNYTVNTTATTTADIAALAIIGAITAANKTYDGTNAATIDSRTLSGVIGGDTVSYVGGTATFSDKNAALGKTVTATGLGLTGADAGNYTVNTTATTTADIATLAITGAITAANKAYDGTTAATITDRSLSGVIAGDTVDYVGGTATFADKNAALNKIVTATGLSLSGVDAANYSVNSTATTTADITALTITGAITAANKVYDGTTAATITDRTLSGVIAGDTVDYVGGTATFADKNAALGKIVTATGLSLAGVDANNYSVNTTATTTADITALAITGAITAANKTYDGTTAATITDRTLSGVIAGDTVDYVGGVATFADKNAGLGKLVTATGLGLAGVDATNYTVNTSATTTADIATLAITGAITAANKTYDGTDAATITDRTLSGVIGGDAVSYVGGTATFADKNAGLGKTVTATGLGLAGADADNYTVNTTALTTADIAALSITGAITAANKTYDGTTAATITDRTLTGVIGGDTVSYVGGIANFSDKNAGLGKTVTATGLGLAGADAGNYTVNTIAATTADIATLAITGAITAANKAYDGTTTATITDRTLTGVIGGDTVSYVGGTANFSDKNAGLGKTVTATGLGLAGLDAGNYTVNDTAATTADIAALAITGAITAANKTYDGTTSATITDRTLTGVISGDAVTYVGGTANFSDKNAGLGKTVTATGLGLAGLDAGNYTVNDTAATTADIATLAITGVISAANKIYDGTTAATITDRTLTGVISGDTVAYVGGTADFADKNVGLGKTVTATGLGLAGLDAGNYSVNTTATTTADIAALAITGAITAANKTYDGTSDATITDRTLTGVISGDAVSYVGGVATFADKNAALGKIVTATGLSLTGVDADNYTVNTTATTTADITTLGITGAITAANKTYDGTTAATITDRTLTGVISGDTVGYVGGVATFADKNAGLGKIVTAAGLGLAGADANNYTVNTTATTTADIAALALAGAITASNKTYDGTDAATISSRTLTGVISGDAVSYVGGTATFADKNAGLGKLVTAIGLGLAGADAGNYIVNDTATTTADIAALGITGAITAANKVYDGDTTATITTRALTGVISGDTVSYVGGTATFADKNAGLAKTVTGVGLTLSGADAGNYMVNTIATTTADITQRPLTVTADIGQTKVYGDADPLPYTYAITSGNLVTGDNLSGALSRDAGENVGGYAITQNTLTAGSNYDLAFLSNPFAITPATLTYVATPVEIFQGVPFPPFTGTVEGFKGTDTLASATTGGLAFTTTAPNSNLPGTFAIDGSGLSANFGNYVFVQDAANATALVIDPAGYPTLPGTPGDAFVGALASAGQSESACAELRDADGQETLCGVQLNYRQSERVNLVPGFRRIIDSAQHTIALDGAGIRLPVGVSQ